MHKLLLEGMLFHARHGVFPEERILTGKFEVNLQLLINADSALQSDQVTDAVNYTAVFAIIKREMEQPVNLLERLAKKIMDSLYVELSNIQHIKIRISKLNPPVGGEMEKFSVELEG
jgi:dihydroneopterin aldolase